MKKYILVGGWREISGKNEITRDDLILVKNKDIDFLIDTEEGKYFDAESNEWKDIEEK